MELSQDLARLAHLMKERGRNTLEEARARSGRRHPYRTEEWPCPACGKAECDADVEAFQLEQNIPVYRHRSFREQPLRVREQN